MTLLQVVNKETSNRTVIPAQDVQSEWGNWGQLSSQPGMCSQSGGTGDSCPPSPGCAVRVGELGTAVLPARDVQSEWGNWGQLSSQPGMCSQSGGTGDSCPHSPGCAVTG